jgi:hypothetical protein
MPEIMDDKIEVWDANAGSADPAIRKQWRTNRNAAYRLGYKDREGKQHPASKEKEAKAFEKELLEKTTPPRGMDWNDFGILWDLHPEHPFTPVLRRRSVSDQFEAAIELENAAKA